MGGRSRPRGDDLRTDIVPPAPGGGDDGDAGDDLLHPRSNSGLSPAGPAAAASAAPPGRPRPAPVPAGRAGRRSARRAAGPGGSAALTAGRGGPTLCLGGWRCGGGSGGTRRGACAAGVAGGHGGLPVHRPGGQHRAAAGPPGRLPGGGAPPPRPAPRGGRGARGVVFETAGDAVDAAFAQAPDAVRGVLAAAGGPGAGALGRDGPTAGPDGPPPRGRWSARTGTPSGRPSRRCAPLAGVALAGDGSQRLISGRGGAARRGELRPEPSWAPSPRILPAPPAPPDHPRRPPGCGRKDGAA